MRLLHLAAALVLQPQIVIFMPERPVVRSDWEYQSLDPVPGRIQPSHLLRALVSVRSRHDAKPRSGSLQRSRHALQSPARNHGHCADHPAGRPTPRSLWGGHRAATSGATGAEFSWPTAPAARPPHGHRHHASPPPPASTSPPGYAATSSGKRCKVVQVPALPVPVADLPADHDVLLVAGDGLLKPPQLGGRVAEVAQGHPLATPVAGLVM